MQSAIEKTLLRPTWATVDLDALAHNFSVIRGRLPAHIQVMAMVKADAYGHGAVPVAKKLLGLGVRAFGVATVEEGLELREAGIKSQILVMGGLMGMGSPASVKMIEAGLTPVIHSTGALEALEADAAKSGKRVGVHIKIDTGMSRLGVRPEVLPNLISKLKETKHLFVEGVMTHLAEANHIPVSTQQMQLFVECKDRIESELGTIRIWHIANSTAVLCGEPVWVPGAQEVWARPGIALYGDANGLDFGGEDLKPVMGLTTQAVLTKRIPAGTKVSYGGTFTTTRKTRLAIVPVGYADGYPWAASGKAFALIRGVRVPVVGRVTMDMIMLDITDVDGVKVGEEVVLLGTQGNAKISLHELAGFAGTISYEILCGISKRMPRIYKGE